MLISRYFSALILTTALGLGALGTVLGIKYWSYRDLHRIDPAVGQITRLAEEKLTSLPPNAIDTVFVGDSSLGYAIDAHIFDGISGTRSVNLALTGTHGHVGALFLLRRAAHRQGRLKNVVLFFSVDAMGWGANLDGRFYMSAWPIEPALSFRTQLQLLNVYVARLTDWREALTQISYWLRGIDRINLSAELRRRGYVASPSKIAPDSPHIVSYNMPREVAAESTIYIKEIGRLCRRMAWNCMYVFGPMLERAIKRNAAEAAYLAQSNQALEAAGIRQLNNGPFPVSDAERGDTIFHVAHDLRERFTQKYAQVLCPALVPERSCK